MPNTVQYTRIDKHVLTAIDRYWRANYIPPTIRWIGKACSIPSTAHVKYIVDKLSAIGLIVTVNGKAIPLWVVQRLDVP